MHLLDPPGKNPSQFKQPIKKDQAKNDQIPSDTFEPDALNYTNSSALNQSIMVEGIISVHDRDTQRARVISRYNQTTVAYEGKNMSNNASRFNSLNKSHLSGLREIHPDQTVSSVATQVDAIFLDINKSQDSKIKEDLMGIPSNHVLYEGKHTIASRSGRIDSLDRICQVVEDGPQALFKELKEVISVPSSKIEMVEQNQSLKGSGYYWKEANSGGYELHHQTHIATALDSSKPDEGQYLTNMGIALNQYKNTHSSKNVIKVEGFGPVIVDSPLVSIAPNSAFSQGTGIFSVGNKVLSLFKWASQIDKNKEQHRNELSHKVSVLFAANKRYDNLTETSISILKKINNNTLKSTDILFALEANTISDFEKLLLKYFNYIMFNIEDTTHDQIEPNNNRNISTILLIESGIAAFDHLSGICSHKSCKSGQDRTLTQVAFKEAITECNGKWPNDTQQRARFAAYFLFSAAQQAKPVIESARGQGGKVKWEISNPLNKQPIPSEMVDWFKSDNDTGCQFLLDHCGENTELLSHVLGGLGSLDLKEIEAQVKSRIS
tara:strand:- start:1181 stop:2830 length:1650 start_codon:yes stop_codon:yes gene_type:complete